MVCDGGMRDVLLYDVVSYSGLVRIESSSGGRLTSLFFPSFISLSQGFTPLSSVLESP